MRPVNLIPPEDRRGDRAPLRSGPLSYVVIGALAVVLLAVLGMVMTQNDIVEREAEVAQLEAQRDAAAQQASQLTPYAEFAALRQVRESTLLSLAQSRFDWERVLRELALVIPSDVTLTSLTASATGPTAEGAAPTGTTISAPGLTISGCATNHESVAGFVAALEDIDGVTRVGLTRSERPEKVKSENATDDPAVAVGGGDACGEAASYDLTAVFDDAAVPPAEAAAPGAVPTPTPTPTPEADPAAGQTAQAEKKPNLVEGAAQP